MAVEQRKKNIQIISANEADAFARNLIGKTASLVWAGYGSAVFLEFGQLTPSARLHPDGSTGHPKGEFTLMIEWSWRIEGRRKIICGSWSDAEIWKKRMLLLQNQTVRDSAYFGNIPEIQVAFTNGARLTSFQTTEASDGNPDWTIFDNRGPEKRWLSWKAGHFVIGA